jgi:hypothetical protein
MKVYRGKRQGPCSGVLVWVMEGELQRPLQHHVHHSPAGFNWGYWGSGPADLARSLCWDVLGHEPPAAVYQEIKREHVAGFGDEWEISESVLREAIERASSAQA